MDQFEEEESEGGETDEDERDERDKGAHWVAEDLYLQEKEAREVFICRVGAFIR